MQLDVKVTQAIQDWLNTPEPMRNITEGANLMLSLNRNRALYNSILKRPDKFLPKLEYELRKYLRMRIDNKTVADVIRMEAKVMPAAEDTLSNTIVLSTEDELPSADVAKGRRQDHDTLPPHIQKLWDDNIPRIRKINLVFNELKAMHDAQPCDRYEKLVILDNLDKAYRSSMSQYDSYVNSATSAPMGAHDVVTDNEKTVNNARKTLSKYRKQLADMSHDDARRQVALEKVQNAVNAIVACKANFAQDTVEELSALGIKFT